MCSRATHANDIHHTFKFRCCGVMALRLYGVEFRAQGGFLGPFAIIPRPPLKAHDQHIIADEMRPQTIAEQSGIGGVGTKDAQVFGAVNPGGGATGLKDGAKIADG